MSAKQTKGAGAGKAGGTASAVTVEILVRAAAGGLAAFMCSELSEIIPRATNAERNFYDPSVGCADSSPYAGEPLSQCVTVAYSV